MYTFSYSLHFCQKGEFIGRSALLKQQEEGVNRMYVQLLLEDHDEETDIWPWGGEPIYRNGKYVGATTTTGYGFTFKQQVICIFLNNISFFNLTRWCSCFCDIKCQ